MGTSALVEARHDLDEVAGPEREQQKWSCTFAVRERDHEKCVPYSLSLGITSMKLQGTCLLSN
jgi:hypothetical protein